MVRTYVAAVGFVQMAGEPNHLGLSRLLLRLAWNSFPPKVHTSYQR
jgi:hypothetical protein